MDIQKGGGGGGLFWLGLSIIFTLALFKHLKSFERRNSFRNSCRFHICSKSVRYPIKLSQSKRRSIESGDTVLFIDYPRLFLFYHFQWCNLCLFCCYADNQGSRGHFLDFRTCLTFKLTLKLAFSVIS